MKKLFLLLAFTGMIGAASASSLSLFSKTSVLTVCGDDKKTDDKKKKDEKACCKKDASQKSCAGKEGKSCCKAKTADTKSATPAAPAPASK